jgi:predicted nucleic-acid-binding protein
MAIAIDTNVLVRFLVDDGSDQVAVARSVFEADKISIPSSVMLECECVLRSAYRIPAAKICDAFARLLNMETVVVFDTEIVARAVDAHRSGVDFADALHVLASAGCDRFVTFDADLRRCSEIFDNIKLAKP